MLAAATVVLMLLGLVFYSRVVQDESGRLISSYGLDPAKVLLVALIILGISVLLWVPVSAYICARIAHNRGLSARRYAIVGAAYSMLFFFPGLYFVMQMCNITVWKPAIWAVYAVLYAGWLLGPVVLTLVLAGLSYGMGGSGALAALFLGLFLAMSIAWGISMFRLLNRHSPSGRHAATVQTGQAVASLIPDVYLAPFVMCFASIGVLLLGGLLAIVIV